MLAATEVPYIIPLYHTTGLSSHLPYTRFLYPNRTEKEFERELDYLLSKFEPVELAEMLRHPSKKRRKPAFHLTIDDGLAVCQEIIAPVLFKKGIPASFFINPAFINDADIMHRYKASLLLDFIERDRAYINLLAELLSLPTDFQVLKNFLLDIRYPRKQILDDCAERIGASWHEMLYGNALYMTDEQLDNVYKAGFTIGAHSWDHPEYETISFELQKQQTESSIRYVQDNFNQEIVSFAFPFTDSGVSGEFFEWLSTQVDVSFGCAGLKLDEAPGHFQRIPVEKYPYGMHSILLRQSGAYFIKKLFGKNKVKHA